MTGSQITDGAIALRGIAAADIALLYEWRNDAETRPMFRDDGPLDFDSHTRFVQTYFDKALKDYWWDCGSRPGARRDHQPLSLQRRRARLRIRPVHHRPRASRLRLRPARAWVLAMGAARALGVERMSCEVLSSNDHALRLYGSSGFRRNGIDHAGQRSFVLMEAELSST